MKKRSSSWLIVAAVAAISVASVVAACRGANPASPSVVERAQGASVPTVAVGNAYSGDRDHGDMTQMPMVSTAKAAAFHDGMRKLWEDHITWTRLFIVSAVAGLPDLSATTNRLLQNQTDIGNAIKPFYGDDAGNQLTALLNDHITTAAALVAAAKAGDTAAVGAASTRWYANADQIATFLSTANPANWPLSDTEAMMKEHLDLTLAEATAHLTGDFAADVAAYDKVHAEILTMADMLSSGVIAQFPDKFK